MSNDSLGKEIIVKSFSSFIVTIIVIVTVGLLIFFIGRFLLRNFDLKEFLIDILTR